VPLTPSHNLSAHSIQRKLFEALFSSSSSSSSSFPSFFWLPLQSYIFQLVISPVFAEFFFFFYEYDSTEEN